MKKKTIVLVATLFAIVGVILIMPLFVSPYKVKPIATIKSKFEISDEENKIKMLLPDSVTKILNETIIAGVPCKVTHYICTPTVDIKIALMIIKMPLETNDSCRKNILLNYFYNIENGQDYNAGKLEGLKYKTYICGVPVTNFIGISGNKIYHYSETVVGDTLKADDLHLNNLKIDVIGQNIKTFLTKNIEPNDSHAIQVNSKQKKIGKKNLVAIAKESEDMNTFRVDISLKTFQDNPDTVLYYIKQHYYALEHTFQKSIACNFEKGASKETISYPTIGYTINLYENGKKVNPYQTIFRSYEGNPERK